MAALILEAGRFIHINFIFPVKKPTGCNITALISIISEQYKSIHVIDKWIELILDKEA